MRIPCIGADPAGLAFVLPRKALEPGHDNRPGDAFGWGGVFSDAILARLRHRDEEQADAVGIARAFTAAGPDVLACSSGQVGKHEHPVAGRRNQKPSGDRVRNESGIATLAGGWP